MDFLNESRKCQPQKYLQNHDNIKVKNPFFFGQTIAEGHQRNFEKKKKYDTFKTMKNQYTEYTKNLK